jgi:hypothetical protein
MITQQEFVEGCFRYYAENDYQQGNPEDGKWEIAHYPVPKCKGGTETILLLREHHAIQGVLQSEEFEHPCIGYWEQDYLPEGYLPLLEKWRAVLKVLCKQGQWGNTTKECRREKCKKQQEMMAQARRKPIEVVYNGERHEFSSIAAATAALGIPSQTLSHRLCNPQGRGQGIRKRHSKKWHNLAVRYL